jgi:uncharacterized iron-regulated membrane protein
LSTNKQTLTPLKLSHKVHKWLMLFIGAQFVIWSITGTYMVYLNIDYIHGDSLVVNHQTKINPENIRYSTQSLYQQYPLAEQLSVGVFIDREVYRFTVNDEQFIVDASTGEQLSPLSKAHVIALAKHSYSANDNIVSTQLITENPPFELSSRHLPAWRVDFDDYTSPSLYISAHTGKVVTKRHQFWRIFDWMFRFHVMDYDDGENINNAFLFIIALLAFFAAISGLMLTYFKVIKPTVSRNTQ